MRANIGLDTKTQTNMATIFKQLLGSTYVLYTKVWGFHWNYVGAGFNDRHNFFGELKDDLSSDVDTLAERVRQFSEVAPGSLSEMLALSKVPETAGVVSGDNNTFPALVANFETLIQAVRKAEAVAASSSDSASSNLLQDFITELEKYLWKLHANIGQQ